MLKTTTVGSFPRKDKQKDTLRKSTVTDQEAFEMIDWAVQDQCDLGLDFITDGEAYRENMYWFYQLRIDGLNCNEKKYKQFTLGGSTENVDLSNNVPERTTVDRYGSITSAFPNSSNKIDNSIGPKPSPPDCSENGIDSHPCSANKFHTFSSKSLDDLTISSRL